MGTKKDELKKYKSEWIQSAKYLQAERFEVAGALFDVSEKELLSETDVKARLSKYRGTGGAQ